MSPFSPPVLKLWGRAILSPSIVLMMSFKKGSDVFLKRVSFVCLFLFIDEEAKREVQESIRRTPEMSEPDGGACQRCDGLIVFEHI